MAQRIGQFTVTVRDYDEALAFYVGTLGFECLEDTDLGGGKRWVRVRPQGGTGAGILLARAATDAQLASVGNQTGGRVFVFLDSDDFGRDYEALVAKGVRFVRPPSQEPYGSVAVFEDLYGNRFDLVGRTAAMPPTSATDDRIGDDLAARSPSECLPLMLRVARAHAARRRPSDLRAQFSQDGFVSPSGLDLRVAHKLDGMALDAAREFEAVLLSPLAPLGTCSALSPSHQNRIVSTARGTEVVSDPTNVLSLECWQSLQRTGAREVRLCTVHQTVRAQRFEAKAGYAQHFRLFALAEAGISRAEHGFEVEAFARHVQVFWHLLDTCTSLGSRFPNRRAQLLFSEKGAPIAARIRKRLHETRPDLPIDEGPLHSGYYDGVRLLFGADGASGQHVNLSDTGLFDWVAKLSSNRRLRFVASGLGLQLLPLLFGPWEKAS
jgi:catechol 2,3-dioxygenase-like lactoylglutathione lyase family enzyme